MLIHCVWFWYLVPSEVGTDFLHLSSQFGEVLIIVVWDSMTALPFWLICHFASSLTCAVFRVGVEKGRERSYPAVGRWLGWWWCQWWFLFTTEKGTGKQHGEEITKPSQDCFSFSRFNHRYLFAFIYFPLCSTLCFTKRDERQFS